LKVRACAFAEFSDLSTQSGDEPFRFFLCSGNPIKEPIAWRGTIVMNTEEELDQTFNEIQNETFIKQ